MVAKSEMVALMGERARARQEKYETVVVDTLPNWRAFRERTVLGQTSITTETRRYIMDSACVDVGFGPQTGPELARDYLAVKFGKPPAMRKAHLPLLPATQKVPPGFAVPGSYGHGFYLDLSAAWWSILLVGGWNVDYLPGRHLAKRSTVNDFPYPDLKTARSALVSASKPAVMYVWVYPRICRLYNGTRFINFPLWCFVQDVLNGVALDMIQHAGAVWVNGDGYIVPREGLPLGFEILQSWGLNGKIKGSGAVVIESCSSYAVGNKITASFGRSVIMHEERLGSDERDYLKPRFRKLAEARERIDAVLDAHGSTQ